MTDITQALRDLAAVIEKSPATMAEHGEIPAELRAAADTIETANAYRDTIEFQVIPMWQSQARAAQAERDEARAEVARLRAEQRHLADRSRIANEAWENGDQGRSLIMLARDIIARAAPGEGTT